MQSDYDNDLQSYFTDMEHLRGMFKDFVSAEKLPKRLIVFHGVGGVGKSSLLRMFRLHCKSEKIPVALASGDDAKSTLDVITRWMEDLKEDGVKFSALHKTLESYRAIQAKVEDQAKKSQNKMADIAGKAASKTAEAAGGALLGAAIGSVVPGVGTAIGGMLGSVVGGMGAEALTDWLRGFLSKPDIDLLLDPAKKLTSDFIEDLAKAAEKKRMVLLLDTYEQMSALEDWVGEAAQKIHPNVLIVIAGRKLPDWNRVWSGWMMNAQVEELKPMTEEVMHQLIHRYYATMRGGVPDPAQVDTIIKFARGLPMVVTSAVQLWVKYGVEDFQAVKAEIVANLVDRLMEGVPGSLIPALEAAAVVRWFDQPILRAVLNKEDVRDVYNELRRFPFMRTRVEGLALHDSVREMMDENLRVQDSERHTDLHERAAQYFEKRLEKVTGQEAERSKLERLYHRVRADEEAGIKLFQEMGEELAQYRLLNRLRTLLNDINMYPLERENSKLWREYYNARLLHSQARLDDAEFIYEKIDKSEYAEPKLHAYALCDLGEIIRRNEYLNEPGGKEKALDVLEQSKEYFPMDSKLALIFLHLKNIYVVYAEWSKALEQLEILLRFFRQNAQTIGIIYTLGYFYDVYGMIGDWGNAAKVTTQGHELLSEIGSTMSIKIRWYETQWHLLWTGHYYESERNLRELVENLKQDGDTYKLPGKMRDLGLALGYQEKYNEALECFNESNRIYKQGTGKRLVGLGVTLGFMGFIAYRNSELDIAERDLIESLSIKQKTKDNIGISEILVWLGYVYEIKDNGMSIAESYFQQCLKDYRWTGRRNYECAALTGLIRVKHAQGDIAAIPPLLAEAEQLAQQYEYNDHLASLRLTQGHLHTETSEVFGDFGSLSALDYYKQAMIYALRYNRFLLDELLSGRPQGTPLRPIIPYCLERGEEGRKLLHALFDWWKTGVNDVGTPRPDTISPIPEGIPLLEAEKLAREREPGDGSMQKSVVEQIEAAIGK